MDILTNALTTIITPTTAAFALAAIGLNIHFGLTGLLNMGHAGFMLIGMYGFGITTWRMDPWLQRVNIEQDWGWSELAVHGLVLSIGFLFALLASAVFAVLLGWPTLKLRGDYLAIVTIAAAEMVRFLGRSQSLQKVTNAATGIRGKDFKPPFEAFSPFPDERVGVGPWTFHGSQSSSWWLIVVVWSVIALVTLGYWRLAKSPWGRVLKGIREDEDAVRSLGKNVYSYKMQALILGGAIGALGGVFWALANSVQPDSMGRPTTFWIWTLLILGGAASVFGPVVGAILFWTSLQLIRGLFTLWVPESILPTVEREPASLMLVGVALMLLIIFRHQGLLGNKKELAING